VKCFAGTVRVDGEAAGKPCPGLVAASSDSARLHYIWLGERAVQVKDLPDDVFSNEDLRPYNADLSVT